VRTHLAIGFPYACGHCGIHAYRVGAVRVSHLNSHEHCQHINFTLPNGDPHSATSAAIGIWSSTGFRVRRHGSILSGADQWGVQQY